MAPKLKEKESRSVGASVSEGSSVAGNFVPPNFALVDTAKGPKLVLTFIVLAAERAYDTYRSREALNVRGAKGGQLSLALALVGHDRLGTISLALLAHGTSPIGITDSAPALIPTPVALLGSASVQPRELSGVAGDVFSAFKVPDPADPQGLSEHELLVLHAEIKALQARYSLSYAEAAHRLEIAEIKELEANVTAMKAFAVIEERIKNSIIHDIRPPIARIDCGDFDNSNFAKGTIGAGSPPGNASSSNSKGTGQ
ncbi:unnamed protein product [Cyclocybe aegerita]|uniref:Uncharacterized protein n=1 Tax=Cyclocybe aegerita TaxID=1973307 RepID=A0A8S0WPI4_CYCAE|nr:unnamed protein product [Cyclocybe aegerita]